MNFDTVANAFRGWVNSLIHVEWLSTLLTIVMLLVVTTIVAHLVTVFLKRALKSSKGPLPAVSLFTNIARIVVWVIGVSVILSSCFGVNVSAAITALGIGGIAVSLGFQETLSNLIGGLQIILTGLIEPGDRIKVGANEGTVRDVTWRHTTITTVRGENIIIPNSVINTEALVKLAPETDIRIDVVIAETESPLTQIVEEMQKDIDAAVSKIAVIETPTSISVNGKNDRGYQALISLSVGEGAKKGIVVDAAMKAISNCAHKTRPPHKERPDSSLWGMRRLSRARKKG